MTNTEKFKISTKTKRLTTCEKSIDVAVTEFKDKYFIIISETGKMGTLVQVSRETSGMETLFNSKVLFGKDEPETNAAACALTETCNLLKPVVFGFSMRNFSSSAVKDLKQVIDTMIEKPPKEATVNVIP
ncbi:hypothetical protein JTE90_003883 [Oedothorax gibbosus]|uniref:Proteasome assembly chaperone 3 n=1 Tax=Oedothorax gibbosus TaxID=931172 RepID=A0AAV6UIT3_9ARAC|nr:hypothetical protein JTE90_003883 [Oedothorax gibbosus]